MAGCEYYVNGEWISVNAFKEMLNAGLLDNLVASKQMTLPGFKVNQDKVVKEETKEVINDSIPAIKLAEILANEIKSRQGYPSNMLSALELNAEQTEFKKDWIMRSLDKSLDQGLRVTPEMIVSEFNIPLDDASKIIDNWFCHRMASLISEASQ
jgi:hypothetical protein